MYAREEQVRQSRDDLMPHQQDVRPSFEMLEAQFGLLVLETTLHALACERHVQQDGQRSFTRGVGDEELDLFGFKDIASHD